MADNRQIASILTLVGGIVTLVFVAFMALFASVFASVFAGAFTGMPDGRGAMPAAFAGAFAGIVLFLALFGLAAGVVLVVASRHLRSDDAQARRSWAGWALAAGIVALLTGGGLVGGGLGIAGAIVAFASDRPAAPN